MAERHYVGVYWEDRAASKEECIAQVGDMLPRLRAHDPLLSRWYLKLGSREETLQAEITEASQHARLDSGLELVGDGRHDRAAPRTFGLAVRLVPSPRVK